MSHLPVFAVVIPMLTALVLLGVQISSGSEDRDVAQQRVLSAASLAIQLGVALALLLRVADGATEVYRLGNWPAPFAIVLVADRLSTWMVTLTTLLSLFVVLAATPGFDRRDRHFHPLVHFQVMGLVGAFLTGDLFNLFVFFEILLIASYALLVFGGGPRRTRATLHYLTLNLIGSALFLIAVGVIYGVLGTLNMADLAVKAARVSAEDAPILAVGGLLLLVVFALKGAAAPLHLWLPSTYRAPMAPVQALFAIMTKVGLYAVLRVFILIFGPGQGEVADLAMPYLLPVGVATLVLGTLGLGWCQQLEQLIGFLLIASVGTQWIAAGGWTPEAVAAALFYLTHSTLLLAGFFLLSESIEHQRGELGGRLSAGPLMAQSKLLGVLFLLAAMATAGLPPTSGFIGKLLVLDSVSAGQTVVVFAAVLSTSFFTLVVLSRAGSVLFWNIAGHDIPTPPARGKADTLLAGVGLLSFGLLLSFFADPLHRHAQRTAEQLFDRSGYIDAVLNDATPAPKAAREAEDFRRHEARGRVAP